MITNCFSCSRTSFKIACSISIISQPSSSPGVYDMYNVIFLYVHIMFPTIYGFNKTSIKACSSLQILISHPYTPIDAGVVAYFVTPHMDTKSSHMLANGCVAPSAPLLQLLHAYPQSPFGPWKPTSPCMHALEHTMASYPGCSQWPGYEAIVR